MSEEKLESEREKLNEVEQREQSTSAEIDKIKQDLENVMIQLQTINVNIEKAEVIYICGTQREADRVAF